MNIYFVIVIYKCNVCLTRGYNSSINNPFTKIINFCSECMVNLIDEICGL